MSGTGNEVSVAIAVIRELSLPRLSAGSPGRGEILRGGCDSIQLAIRITLYRGAENSSTARLPVYSFLMVRSNDPGKRPETSVR